MAYKARRTRDLQGEVKAGTGISVTESVNPDGTKEYTITNGDPASAITVSGEGLSLIANVLKNTMAEELGFHAQTGSQSTSINWYDDNSDPVLIIQELERLFIGDVKDNAGFFLKQESSTDNKLISGDIQIVNDLIATSGVSLQTLADMANSAARFTCSTDYYNGTFFQASANISIKDIPENSFFEENITQLTYGGIEFVGVLIKKSGIYRYEQRIEIVIETSAPLAYKNLYCNLIAVDEDGQPSTKSSYYSYFVEIGANEYYGVIDIATIININSGLTVGFEASFDATNVIQVSVPSDDPTLSIQKIR